MSYLGINPADSAVINKREYIATAGQTTFPCLYGEYVEVYLNGSRLAADDFTATDSMNVVLTLAAEADDVIVCSGYENARFDNSVSTTGTDTISGVKTFTAQPVGIVKASVGLGNVDDTSDASKPVSTATQTALNLKANLDSPTFTNTVTATTFSGELIGNASTATEASYAVDSYQCVEAQRSYSLSNGFLGCIPYQIEADATAMLAPGTSGYYLKSNGAAAPSWAAVAAGGLPSNSQTFTSSGTFTVPTGVAKLWIRYCSGGGGGTGGKAQITTYYSGMHGGGSSGYLYELLSVTAGSALTVTIGAGGVGGTGTSAGLGGTGGQSTVTGSQIGHTGGGGGLSYTSNTAFSQAGAGGGSGGNAPSKGSATAGYNAGTGPVGNGAGGAGGNGGNGMGDTVNSAGQGGQGYGAGGGAGGGTGVGGAGYQGIVSIYW